MCTPTSIPAGGLTPMTDTFTPTGLTPIVYERQYPHQDPNDLIYADPNDLGNTFGNMDTIFSPDYSATDMSAFDTNPPAATFRAADAFSNAPAAASSGSSASSSSSGSQHRFESKFDEQPPPSTSTGGYTSAAASSSTSSSFGTTHSGSSSSFDAAPTTYSSAFPPPPKLSRAYSHKAFPFEALLGRYTFDKFLGEGSYGKVISATCRRTGNKVAIKKVEGVFLNNTMALRLLRELRILRELRNCALVINILDILPPLDMNNFDDLYIVFQYCETDLEKLIHSKQYLTDVQVKWILWQLLVGLKYIHSSGIVHRDLKPANILMNLDCSLSICDFGLARGIDKAQRDDGLLLDTLNKLFGTDPFDGLRSPASGRALTTHVVTRWYRAPEVLLKSRYSTPIDLWSVGCIFGDLLGMQRENVSDHHFRRCLFPGHSSSLTPLAGGEDLKFDEETSKDQLNVIFNVIGTEDVRKLAKSADDLPGHLKERKVANYKEKFPRASRQALDLLNGFLKFHPAERLTVDDALKHPYLEEIRNRQYEIDGKEVRFEFEGIRLDKRVLRRLILDEVAFYNPNHGRMI